VSSCTSGLTERYLAKSRRRLERAKKDFEEAYYEDAVSRAYYALFYAVQAALLAEGSQPKTHRGALSEFNRIYVKSRRVDPSCGKLLSKALALRERSDYDVTAEIDADAAVELLRDTEEFVRMVESMVRG